MSEDLVTTDATFTRKDDGGLSIVSVGGTDPQLTADEVESLADYLADTEADVKAAAKAAKAEAKP